MNLPPTSKKEAVTAPTEEIEVCTGPDCSAGGAALLEIEELVTEDGANWDLVRGGCRNLCSMGPNVHCRSTHFSKVKSPEDCLSLAMESGMDLPYDDLESTTHSRVASMMMKKAHRLRWQVLRDVGRYTARTLHRSSKPGNLPSKSRSHEWLSNLRVAHEAEMKAAQMFAGEASQRRSRAVRRHERLQEMIRRHISRP